MSRLGLLSAPGKMMVVGEYAVLQGGPSVVAAVDRRARLAWTATGSGSGSLPPEVVAARREAEARLGSVEAGLTFDPSALRSATQKLGLGSSAAGAAAAAAAVYHAHGMDLSDAATQQAVLECAFAGHAAVAPRGSGADVAASALGGFVSFSRPDLSPRPPPPPRSQPGSVYQPPPRPQPGSMYQPSYHKTEPGSVYRAEALAWPVSLATCVVWTGQEARTSDFLDRVEGLAGRDPGLHESCMTRLTALAAEFIGGLDRGDSAAIPTLASAYGEAMGALGDAAGVGILTDTLKRIQEVADRAGGGAKPSGAGGGDVALALFADPDAAARFVQECGAQGLQVLDLRLGAEGVRSESERAS